MTKYYTYGLILSGMLFLFGLYLVQLEYKPEAENYALKLDRKYAEFIDSIHIAVEPISKVKGIYLHTNLIDNDSTLLT